MMGTRLRLTAGRAFAGALLATALAASASARAEPVIVTFLHANDAYEMAPEEGRGGFAPFATLLGRERAAREHAITTFGGDLISPSILSGLTKGRQMIELTNAIGVDVAVPGNHEFDFGPEVASERFAESEYPWLGTNIRTRDGRPLQGTIDLHVVEVGGYRIGFIGLLTPETSTLSSPGRDVAFGDPLAAAEAAAGRLREEEGADLVVALTHMGLAADRELARRVEGVDVVLGGHDHDPMTVYEGGKLIVKAGHDLHYLAAADVALDRVVGGDGKEEVVWRPAGWRYVATAGVEPDPEVAAVVARWEERLGEELSLPVGETAVELDTRRSTVRGGESNFGNLVADAMRAATGADVAITNGGGIRGDRTYPAGTVLTRRDVLTELPFGNVAVLLELRGADLLAALENGVSQVEEGGGRFPQVSGLRLAFDPRRPAGERVTRVEVGDAPLDPEATYRVATNDYMAGGGDGYAALARGRSIIDASGGELMASTVIAHVAALGGKLAPSAEGRIVRAE